MVTLVTGGGRGIGAAIVTALTAAGSSVVIADRSLEGAPSADGAYSVDVADAASVAAMVTAIVSDFGGLDAACNCAGVTGQRAPLSQYPAAVYRRVMAVNADGVFNCLQSELAVMAAAGAGAVVNIASGAASLGVRGSAAYVASKHAVAGLTRTAAIEYAAQGVRVNAVAPGLVQTGAVDLDSERFAAAHPIGRAVRADEVAAVVTWLLLNAPLSLTGAVIPVDGGLAAQVAGLA